MVLPVCRFVRLGSHAMYAVVIVTVPFGDMYLLQLSLSKQLLILPFLLSQQLYYFVYLLPPQSSLKMISKAKSKRFLASSLVVLAAAIASETHAESAGINPALRGGANPSAEYLFPMTRRLTTLFPETPVCYNYDDMDAMGTDLRFRHRAELSINRNCPVKTGDCVANDLTVLDAR